MRGASVAPETTVQPASEPALQPPGGPIRRNQQEARSMTLTRRPSPFSEVVTLRQAMDRLFDDTVFRPLSAYSRQGDLARLPLDVRTTPDALLVEAALPGIAPEDVDI